MRSLLIVGVLAVPAVMGQSPMEPVHLSRPPTLDGIVGDAEWAEAPALPLVALYPTSGVPPKERTEIRVAYDERYFYASIRAWDSKPETIRPTTLYRDRWQVDEEFVVILDTFSDGQNAAMFLVTPAGVRIDNQLTNDAEPGRGEWMNRDWNVPWDASAAQLSDGWSAELRVPFSSLRFAVADGDAAMRLKVYRYQPRTGENQIYPETRPDAGAFPHFKPSLGQPVVFRGVRPAVPVYVQPFISGTTASGQGEDRTSGILDVGVDIKVSPTRSSTLDLTLNTDFAQVEADQLQVNLTRFPLRFPERRPFFLERAGLFAVGLGADDTLFHSRRIGLGDDGRPEPILGGARLVGRVGAFDLGALSVQTRPQGADSGSQNASVLRAQLVSPAGHTLGVTATSLVAGGVSDVAGALDASVSIGRQRLSTVMATVSGPAPLAERSRAMVRWQRGTQRGVSYSGEYRFTGNAFRPGLGFVRVTDSHEANTTVRQSWRPGAASALRSYGFVVDTTARWRREDTRLEEARVSAGWNLETSGGLFGAVSSSVTEEDVIRPFTVTGGTTVAAGHYRMKAGRVYLATPPTSAFRLSAEFTAGGFYGGRRYGWMLSPRWIPGPHFEAWAVIDQSRLTRMSTASPTITLTRAGIRTAVNTHLFLDLTAQRTVGRPTIGQARVRWNLSEGHDVWIVADQGLSAIGTSQYSLTMKYSQLLSVFGGAL